MTWYWWVSGAILVVVALGWAVEEVFFWFQDRKSPKTDENWPKRPKKGQNRPQSPDEPHLELICPECSLWSCSECPGWRNRHTKECSRGY